VPSGSKEDACGADSVTAGTVMRRGTVAVTGMLAALGAAGAAEGEGLATPRDALGMAAPSRSISTLFMTRAGCSKAAPSKDTMAA
jgi:hypothetical protein